MLVPLFRIEQALDEHFMDIEKAQYKMDTDSAYECGYQQGRADERKEIFDELYFKILNDDADSIIEWVQDNIIDDADEYAEQLKEQKE